MFSEYTASELGAIFAMQGFAGLILFSVFVLMALGLAIIFGQMGVINMAHGEFMILGAYVTYLVSNLFGDLMPALFSGYFFVAMILAFLAAGALGMFVEWALIRHLYKRPLDTLLATWGLSLILQQLYRSIFGAREVGVTIPDWMMGSLPLTDLIEVPINGIFVMVLAVGISAGVYVMMYRSRWGQQVRAINNNRQMADAVGINTALTDRMTFGIGCGVAGVAGSAFTMAHMWPQLAPFNFNDLHKVDVPVFLFMGRHDYTTPPEIAANWIGKLDAPQKKLVYFEHSAHLPMVEEPGRVLVSLLELARPLAEEAPAE